MPLQQMQGQPSVPSNQIQAMPNHQQIPSQLQQQQPQQQQQLFNPPQSYPPPQTHQPVPHQHMLQAPQKQQTPRGRGRGTDGGFGGHPSQPGLGFGRGLSTLDGPQAPRSAAKSAYAAALAEQVISRRFEYGLDFSSLHFFFECYSVIAILPSLLCLASCSSLIHSFVASFTNLQVNAKKAAEAANKALELRASYERLSAAPFATPQKGNAGYQQQQQQPPVADVMQQRGASHDNASSAMTAPPYGSGNGGNYPLAGGYGNGTGASYPTNVNGSNHARGGGSGNARPPLVGGGGLLGSGSGNSDPAVMERRQKEIAHAQELKRQMEVRACPVNF